MNTTSKNEDDPKYDDEPKNEDVTKHEVNSKIKQITSFLEIKGMGNKSQIVLIYF